MKCFVIMPISTPENAVSLYGGDKDHFQHVYTFLIEPALAKAGLEAISPIAEGSGLIHGDVIHHIATADWAICDISTLNPNVFFEFGIRTALNKPAIIIKDSHTSRIPFDTAIINTHTYHPNLAKWEVEQEIDKLARHCANSIAKGNGQNALWHNFAVSVTATPIAAPTSAVGRTLELLNLQVEALRHELRDRHTEIPFPGKTASHVGVNGANLTGEQIERLRDIIGKSGVVEAIREYRKLTGVNFEQARAFVARIA